MKKSESGKQGNFFEGNIMVTRKGTGFLNIGENKKDRTKDIFIDRQFLNTALNGDEVKVALHAKKSREGLMTGEVVEIEARAKAGFAGKLEADTSASLSTGKDAYYLVPDDLKMYTDIVVLKENLGGAKVGEKVFVEIIHWRDSKQNPEGKVVKVLGKVGDNNAEMLSIAMDQGFDSSFPKKSEDEAARALQNKISDEVGKRRDMRGVLTLTIDPEDAKDFDDAISIKEVGNDFEVGIHIADVSHFVPLGSELDKEARKRGTSVYLVDRTIPMLPEILSNDLCSLKPDVDRLAMSAIFIIGKNGNVKDEWFGKTIIRSQKRFTYAEAEEVIKTEQGTFAKELKILNEIARKSVKEKIDRGAILIEQQEVKFVLDEKGIPIKVIKKEIGEANNMIEELMLLANKKVAEKISKDPILKDLLIYRIHDQPSEEKMAGLIDFLRSAGYESVTEKGYIPSNELNKILSGLKGKAEKDMIHKAIVRSMSKAIYSTKNIGHYGLAFKHYTHFTSPIRRYPDIVAHRLLMGALGDNSQVIKQVKEYDKIASECSLREKGASEAERNSIKYKQIEYMSYRVGQKFEGVISWIAEWGIYVEEAETKCEGMVKLRDVSKKENFIFNEKKFELKGEKTGKTYRLGDKVKIEVVSADLEKKAIDYKFI